MSKGINSLPNDKISHWSDFKAFADDKINVAIKIEICFGEALKHCGKVGNM